MVRIHNLKRNIGRIKKKKKNPHVWKIRYIIPANIIINAVSPRPKIILIRDMVKLYTEYYAWILDY